VNRCRIYPTKSPVTKLNHTLDLCRWAYNETLALRKNAWKSEIVGFEHKVESITGDFFNLYQGYSPKFVSKYFGL
jgi:transposase